MVVTSGKLFMQTAVLLICIFTVPACSNDLKDIKALTEKRTSVEEGYQIESYLSQQSKMKAKLTAPLMKRYQTDTPYTEFPKTLHVDFYDDSLHIESKLDAHYGKYRESEQKVFLKDSVVISNMKGDTLWCRELWWDQNTQHFYTDKAVRIRQPDKIIFGTGLTASQTLSPWTIFKVSGILHVPKEGLQ